VSDNRDGESSNVLEIFADEAEDALGFIADDDELLKVFPEELSDHEKIRLLEIAGLTQLSFLHIDPGAYQGLPEKVRGKVLEKANEFINQSEGAAQKPPAHPGKIRQAEIGPVPAQPEAGRKFQSRLGWLLAAALAIAFVTYRTDVEIGDRATSTVATTSASDARATLIDSAADLVQSPWAPSAEPEYENVTGDVVWSTSDQRGFLALSGLASNDPRIAQYQLWIVDPERDTHPIDGGVFDIPPGSVDVVIPITAKLRVDSVTAFAITLEKPGGVVVSDGPLLLVAPITI
jgi:hypothetical protein